MSHPPKTRTHEEQHKAPENRRNINDTEGTLDDLYEEPMQEVNSVKRTDTNIADSDTPNRSGVAVEPVERQEAPQDQQNVQAQGQNQQPNDIHALEPAAQKGSGQDQPVVQPETEGQVETQVQQNQDQTLPPPQDNPQVQDQQQNPQNTPPTPPLQGGATPPAGNSQDQAPQTDLSAANALGSLISGIEETQKREQEAKEQQTTETTTGTASTNQQQTTQNNTSQDGGDSSGEDYAMVEARDTTPSQTTTAPDYLQGFGDNKRDEAEVTKENEINGLKQKAKSWFRKAGLAVGRSVGFGKNLLQPSLWTADKLNDPFLTEPAQANAAVDITVPNPDAKEAVSDAAAFLNDKKAEVEKAVEAWLTKMNSKYPDMAEAAGLRPKPQPQAQQEQEQRQPQNQAQGETSNPAAPLKTQIMDGFLGGFNQGVQVGRALQRQAKQQEADREKAKPEYQEGLRLGKEAGMKMAMGQMTTEENNALRDQTAARILQDAQAPQGTTDPGEVQKAKAAARDLFLSAYNEHFNAGYREGRQGVVKQRQDALKGDAGYQAGETLGVAIGTQLAAKDKVQAAAALQEAGTLPQGMGIDQAMTMANQNIDPKTGTPVQGQYADGFNSGFNRGYMTGRQAIKRQRELQVQGDMQNPHFQLGVAVAQLRIAAMMDPTVRSLPCGTPEQQAARQTALRAAIDANTAVNALNNGAKIKELAKKEDPSTAYNPASDNPNVQIDDSSIAKFQDGYNRVINNPKAATLAVQNQRQAAQEALMRDPQYAQGVAEGQAAGKAKLMLQEYEEYLRLKSQNPEPGTNARLTELEQKIGSQLDRYAAMKERVDAMLAAVADKDGKPNEEKTEKYKQGFNAAFNTAYKRSQNQKAEADKEARLKANRDLVDKNNKSPQSQGFQQGQELGKRVRSELLKPEADRATILQKANAIHERVKEDENANKQGPGFYSGFSYGYNVGLMNARLEGTEESLSNSTEAAKRKMSKDLAGKQGLSPQDKTAIASQVDEGSKIAYDYWFKATKVGMSIEAIQNKFGENILEKLKKEFDAPVANNLELFKIAEKIRKPYLEGGKLKTDDKTKMVLTSSFDAFYRGYSEGKKFGQKDGEAYKKGYDDGINGNPKAAGGGEHYEKGYKEGEAGGGFAVFRSQMGMNEEDEGAQEAAMYGLKADGTRQEGISEDQRRSYMEGYRQAYSAWQIIHFKKEGLPLPEGMSDGGWQIEGDVFGNDNLFETQTAGVEVELSDREKALQYFNRKEAYIQKAVKNHNKAAGKFAELYNAKASELKKENESASRTGAGGGSSTELTPTQRQEAYNHAQSELKRLAAGGDQDAKKELSQGKGYEDGYKKGVESALKSGLNKAKSSLHFAYGYEYGFFESGGGNTDSGKKVERRAPNPLDAAIRATPEFQKGYDQGSSQALKEKLGIAEDNLQSNDANLMGEQERTLYDRAFEAGKGEGENETADYSGLEQAMEGEMEGLNDTLKDVYRSGYAKGFAETFNPRKGQLDGYFSEWKKVDEYGLVLLSAENQALNQDAYDEGFKSGRERAVADRAVGLGFDPEFLERQAKAVAKQTENRKSAEKKAKEEAEKDMPALQKAPLEGYKKGRMAGAAQFRKNKEPKKQEQPTQQQQTQQQQIPGGGGQSTPTTPSTDNVHQTRTQAGIEFLKEAIKNEAQQEKKIGMLNGVSEPSDRLLLYVHLYKNIDDVFSDADTSKATARVEENWTLIENAVKKYIHQGLGKNTLAAIEELKKVKEGETEEQKKRREDELKAKEEAVRETKRLFQELAAGVFFGAQLKEWKKIFYAFSNEYEKGYKEGLESGKGKDEDEAKDSPFGEDMAELGKKHGEYVALRDLLKNLHDPELKAFVDDLFVNHASEINYNETRRMADKDAGADASADALLKADKNPFLELARQSRMMSDTQMADLEVFIGNLDYCLPMFKSDEYAALIRDAEAAFGGKEGDAAKKTDAITELKTKYGGDGNQRLLIRLYEEAATDKVKKEYLTLYKNAASGKSKNGERPEHALEYLRLMQSSQADPRKRAVVQLFAEMRQHQNTFGNLVGGINDFPVQNPADLWNKLKSEDQRFAQFTANNPEALLRSAYERAYSQAHAAKTMDATGRFMHSGMSYMAAGSGSGVGSSDDLAQQGAEQKSSGTGGHLGDSLVEGSIVVKAFSELALLRAGLYREVTPEKIKPVPPALLQAYAEAAKGEDEKLQEQIQKHSEPNYQDIAQKNLEALQQLEADNLPEESVQFLLEDRNRELWYRHLLQDTDYLELKNLDFKTELNHEGKFQIVNNGRLIQEKTAAQTHIESQDMQVEIPVENSPDQGIAFKSAGMAYDEKQKALRFLRGTVVIPRLEGGIHTVHYREFFADLHFENATWMELIDNHTMLPEEIRNQWQYKGVPLSGGDLGKEQA